MKLNFKLKNALSYTIGLVCLSIHAHEVPVHRAITFKAAESAYENSPAYKKFADVIFSDFAYIGAIGATNSMIDGSAHEDDPASPNPPVFGAGGGWRSLNHFYDPLDGTYNKGLSDYPPDLRITAGINSFAWASVSNGLGFNFHDPLHLGSNLGTSNIWSWQNARGYQWLGLTATNQLARQTNLDDMFRAVGQVMHLLEDISQPQHVRNEQHVDKLGKLWKSPIEDYGKKHYNTDLNYGDGSMLNWRGAGFTKLKDFWDRSLYAPGNAAVLNADNSENPNGGPNTLGLAEWCDGNFLGDRHLFPEYFKSSDIEYYPFPSRSHSTDYSDVRANPAAHIGTWHLKNGKSGNGIYLAKTGDGVTYNHIARVNYLGAKLPNAGLKGITYCTIRDENVLQDYHAKLIPKAVKYSAGLLDYYFRGNLSVGVTNLPDSTVALYITNSSSQDFSGGAFQFFYDNTNGVRTEITGDKLPLTSSLATNASRIAILHPQAGATNYLVVYQGTIGTSSGSAADPVDAGIAIAAKNFAVCSSCALNLDNSLTESSPRATYRPDSYCARFPIHVTAGMAVRITEISGDFDCYLFLLDSDGNEVAENDDAGGSLHYNSSITSEITSTGDYIIEASTFDDDTLGAFSLSCECGFLNDEQTATVTCSSGHSFTNTVAAGTVLSTVSKDDANEQALTQATALAQAQCCSGNVNIGDLTWGDSFSYQIQNIFDYSTSASGGTVYPFGELRR